MTIPLSRYWLHIYAVVAVLIWAGTALGQSNHSLGHASYMSWVNGNNQGCCNNRDCGALAEGQEQEINGRLHVYVRGVGVAKGQSAWCPVLPHHYLKAGNAPDWQHAHACVSDFYGATTPCAQFICYQPRPLF